jgi:hypothetical protein
MTKCERCNGTMLAESDRVRCMSCGNSHWHDFELRKPKREEMMLIGRPTGMKRNKLNRIADALS